jgi:hypothetical protein
LLLPGILGLVAAVDLDAMTTMMMFSAAVAVGAEEPLVPVRVSGAEGLVLLPLLPVVLWMTSFLTTKKTCVCSTTNHPCLLTTCYCDTIDCCFFFARKKNLVLCPW